MRLELLDRFIDLPKLSLKKKPQKSRRNIRLHFLIDGNITSYGLAPISQSNFSNLQSDDNCLQIETAAKKGIAHYYGAIRAAPKSLKPSKVLMDSFDNDLEISYDLNIEPGKTCELALIAAGSLSTLEDCLDEYRYIRDNYRQLLDDTDNHFKTVPNFYSPYRNKSEAKLYHLEVS